MVKVMKMMMMIMMVVSVEQRLGWDYAHEEKTFGCPNMEIYH
jgi:hypothetical protein